MRSSVKRYQVLWITGALVILVLILAAIISSGHSEPKVSYTSTAQPTMSAQPTIKPTVTPNVDTFTKSPAPKPVVTPKVTVTPKPTVSGKPTLKAKDKPVTPIKFGNTIPIIKSNLLPTAGKEFDPGYYYNAKDGCDVGVYDAKGNEIYSVMTSDNEQSIYFFKAGERVQNFCTLTKGTPPMNEGGDVLSGIHLIGVDIKPGIYTTSSTCHFWIGNSADNLNYIRSATTGSGQLNSISSGGQITVPDNGGVILFHSECQNITKTK